MAKHSTPNDRRKAKRLYMDRHTQQEIADRVGFGKVTVAKWVKEGGWKEERLKMERERAQAHVDATPEVNFDAITADPDVTVAVGPVTVHDEPTTSTAATVDSYEIAPEYVPDPTSRSTIDELTREVEQLRAKNAELAGELEQVSPTRDISLYVTDPVAWIDLTNPEGDQYWVDRAELALSALSDERHGRGLSRISLDNSPDLIAQKVEELKQDERDRRNRPITDAASRTIKMIIDRNGVPTIEQLPYEPTINNWNGSLADPIVRYTRKGFKMTNPLLCPRRGCYAPGSLDELGRLNFDGYCGEYHRNEVEGRRVTDDRGQTHQAMVTMQRGAGAAI